MRESARRIAGNANHVLDARPLREVVGGDNRNEVRRAVLLHVVRDRKSGIGEQIADQEMRIILLDELARLLQRRVRIGGVVLDEELDLPAGNLITDAVKIE